MKGCFLLQRQFAYIGHFLAQDLKERYGVNEFCGFVYLRSSYDFLIKQTDVPYTALLLDEELHERFKREPLDRDFLARFEKEYGIPSCWPYLAVDRIILSQQLVREYPYDRCPYTHEELLRLLQVYAKAILAFLEREKPDFLFGSVIGGLGSSLFYHIAKKQGLKTILLLPSCLRERCILSETYDRFTWVDELVQQHPSTFQSATMTKDADAFLSSFRAKPIPYSAKYTPEQQAVSRRRQFQFFKVKNLVHSIRALVRMAVQSLSGADRHDYSTVRFWYYLADRIKRKLRNLVGADHLYDQMDANDDFVFFPLHLEPEIALLLQAPYYTDQLHLARQIARSLPVQYKLYVKDHPVMAEFRSASYYKILKKIPNVKLISPTVSSLAIIPKAKLITTITGTVGWEAILLGKPIITFGHWFYNSLPFVKRCDRIEDLPVLIRDRLASNPHSDAALKTFLSALLTDSIPADLQQLWEDEHDLEKKHEGIKPIADVLAKKLNLA